MNGDADGWVEWMHVHLPLGQLSDYAGAVVGRSSRLSLELVSPSGREQQQGLGPGTRASSLGGPAADQWGPTVPAYVVG